MAISPGSKAVVESLSNHITELHAEWKVLLQLYGVGKERTDFLFGVAGSFFDTVYRTLIRDILLGIARLTDPARTGPKTKKKGAVKPKTNLVLERLARLPEVRTHSELLAAVRAKLAEIKTKSAAIRDYRNKYLAHLDLRAALGPTSDVLPGIKRQDIQAVLDDFAELFNFVGSRLGEPAIMFTNVSLIGGPKALVKHLEDAKTWRSLPPGKRQALLGEIVGASGSG